MTIAVRLRTLALASASALVFATPGFAQQVAAPPAEEPSTLEPITVLATKTREETIDAKAAVGSLREKDLARIGPRRVSDVFEALPGVDATQEESDDPATSISIRGLQDFGRVAVIVDGARQDYQRSGHNANGMFYLDPEMISSVDVVRGPVANVYGSGAIGGVVSIDTKTADDILRAGEKAGVLFNGSAASNTGELLGSTFVGARAGDAADIVVGGVKRHSNNYDDGDGDKVQDSGQSIESGMAKLRIRPADGHELTFSGLVYGADYTNGAWGPPARRVKHDVDQKQASVKWTYASPDNPLIDLSISTYWTRTEDDQERLTPGAFGAPAGSTLFFKIGTVGADIHNSSRFTTGEVENTLTYGVDVFRDKVHVEDSAGTNDLFTPTGERTVSGGFAEWQAKYNWLELIGGLRYDHYQLKGDGEKADGARLSPKGTVAVTPLSWLSVYGTYAEGYRAPSVTETLISGTHPAVIPGVPGSTFDLLPNFDLKSEVGRTKEIGVNIKQDGVFIAGDKVRLKANVFQNDITNFIDLAERPGTPFQLFPGGPFLTLANQTYDNIAKARIKGFELEGQYDMGRVYGLLAYAYQHGRNKENGGDLISVQPQKLSTTVGFRAFDERLDAGVRVTWYGKRDASDSSLGSFGDSALVKAPSFTRLDLYGSYAISEAATAYVNLNNVTDKKYTRYLAADASPGFVAKAGLKVRLGMK
jgi:hemoglobin/transferrin/lactoferrin receptor protein